MPVIKIVFGAGAMLLYGALAFLLLRSIDTIATMDDAVVKDLLRERPETYLFLAAALAVNGLGLLAGVYLHLQTGMMVESMDLPFVGALIGSIGVFFFGYSIQASVDAHGGDTA
ncbi:MAG: hypothetical protein SVU32_09150 [Candidatus Nanohaloarchaea archaeon]|nr:hypothetical protein [Candidatus Nanohaloarchaea archaeon]